MPCDSMQASRSREHAPLSQKAVFPSSLYFETNCSVRASELMEKGSEGVMKRACLKIVLGLILTGSVAYAQTRGSGRGEMGSRNGFVEHAPPASFHGNSGLRVNGSMQRIIGESHGFSHSGIGGGGFSGERGIGRGFGDHHIFRGGLFDHGFGRGRGVVVFVYGAPYYDYPSYGYPN